MFGLVAHAETALRPWLRLGGALLSELALDAALRELVILRVGQLAARYEWEQHVPIALSVGVPQDRIDALDREDWPAFDAATRAAALDFVTGVVEGDLELALLAGHFLGLARVMTAPRIDSDPPAGADGLLRG